jgi:glycosyltransferase involved in cell wall biosynthesis
MRRAPGWCRTASARAGMRTERTHVGDGQRLDSASPMPLPVDPGHDPLPAKGDRDAALFVAGDLPWPPDGGGRIATYRVLEAMAERFELDLVAIADPVGPPDLGRLTELCRSVEVVSHPFTFGRHPIRQLAVAAASTVSHQPYRLRKFDSRRLSATIERLRASRPYAFIHHDQFGVAPYRSADLPSTFTHQNVESEIYRLGASQARDPLRRIWLAREQQKLAAAERSILGGFDEVFVLAAEDAALLADLGVTRTSVLPMPAPPLATPRTPPLEPTILSLGSMSWFGVTKGLLWFAAEVLPLVRAAVPGVRWRIVGAHPNRRIRQLADQPGIEVLGHVTDLSPIVESTRLAIVPLSVAGGIRMKLLDFMAWRIPSVATSLASRGLAFEDGQGTWRRDDPAGFAEAVVRLLADDGAWMATVEGGVAYIDGHHRPEFLQRAVHAGVDRAIAHHRVGSPA